MSAAEVHDYGTEPAVARFSEWVENAVNGADYLRDALAGNGAASLPDLARLLAAIREAQAKLALVQRECEADVAAAVKASGEREPEVPGVGVLKVRNAKRTDWDSSRLFASLLRTTADRVHERVTVPEEVLDEFEAAALDVLGSCLPITPSLGWRAGALREAGYDPDDFRATTSTGMRVQIVEPSA